MEEEEQGSCEGGGGTPLKEEDEREKESSNGANCVAPECVEGSGRGGSDHGGSQRTCIPPFPPQEFGPVRRPGGRVERGSGRLPHRQGW